jgi:putative oxygen-independent coproporphyrinogen III oxidase
LQQNHSYKSLKNFNPNKVPLSLYIHLPWCEKKCPYCDFNINTNKSEGDEDKLLNALYQDLRGSDQYIQNRKLSSVYFGGGTPSLVSAKMIKKILKNLQDMDLFEEGCEISFELNPKEVTHAYIEEIVKAGINRISIGIQSFDQNMLDILERNHSSNDSYQAIKIASKFKEINTSIDLIYGIMNQSVESLKKDIQVFCESKISHLSLYQLTIEPNTIFYKRELNIPSDKTVELMEVAAKETLNANDIFQYEVSSWAKNNSFSKHNMNYWLYGDYLGIGPGAHSKITEKSSITRMIKLKKVESYMSNPLKITKIHIDNSSYDLDLAMNVLRVKNGVSFEMLEKRGVHISKSFKEKLQHGYENGLIDQNLIKATDQGYKFLNDTINTFS